MPWSASIAQLVATALMIILRIVVHRRISIMPEDVRTFQAPQGHELDRLAKDIHECSSWHITMPPNMENGDTVPKSDSPTTSSGVEDLASSSSRPEKSRRGTANTGNELVATRIRLTQFTSWLSNSDSAEMAKRVCAVAEDILRYLYQSHNGGLTVVKESARNMDKFDWKLGVSFQAPYGTSPKMAPENQDLAISFSRAKQDGRWNAWKADIDQVDATLSLWLSSFSEHFFRQKVAQRNFWILGRNDIENRSVYDWWIDREENKVSVFSDLGQVCDEHGVNISRVFDLSGCWPAASDAQNTIPFFGTSTNGNLVTACGQLLLACFLRSAGVLFDTLKGKAVVTLSNKSKDEAAQFLITHQTVREVADILQQSGLVSVEDSYRLVIPPFHDFGILPGSYDLLSDMRTLPSYEDAWHENSLQIMPSFSPNRNAFLQIRLAYLCRERAQHLISQDQWAKAGAMFGDVISILSNLSKKNEQQGNWFEQKLNEAMKEFVIESRKKFAIELVESSASTSPGLELSPSLLYSPSGQHPVAKRGLIGQVLHVLVDGIERVGSSDLEFHQDNLFSLAFKNDDLDIARLVLFYINDSEKKYERTVALAVTQKSIGDQMLRFLSKLEAFNDEMDFLFWEAYNNGHDRLLEVLLEGGFDVTADSALGPAPLVRACSKSDAREDVIRVLLKGGADVSVKKEGLTALHFAAKNGYQKIVEILITEGQADPNVADEKSQQKPLHMASENGHKEIVHILLKNGADASAKDTAGLTALHYASGQGHLEIVKILVVEAMADPNVAASEDYGTALNMALMKGHLNIFEWLQREGLAKVEATNARGLTSLHQAAQTGNLLVVKTLITQGKANPNTGDGFDGSAALHMAAEHNHSEVVSWLLEYADANVDALNAWGRTPLHVAAGCDENRESTIGILIRHGSNVSAKNRNLQTPLDLAAHIGQPLSVIQLLIDKGASWTNRDKFGRTALHHAVMQSRWANEDKTPEVARLLLRKGAPINAADHDGWTPLHYAYCTYTGTGKSEIVNMLLERRPNTRRRDKDGRTADFYSGKKLRIFRGAGALESIRRGY